MSSDKSDDILEESDIGDGMISVFSRYQVDGVNMAALMPKTEINKVLNFCGRFSGLSEEKSQVER